MSNKTGSKQIQCVYHLLKTKYKAQKLPRKEKDLLNFFKTQFI